MSRKSLLSSLVLVGVFLLSYPALAQSATISGTVSDDSGGILPGVSVIVTHLDTSRVREVVTDDEGRYRATSLALGNYEVEAGLTGFQTTVRSGITLTVGQQAVIDLTLSVGSITERVVVTGDAPLVDTTSSTVTSLVDDRTIRDLPLNGRDFSQLATLQVGVYAPPHMGKAVSSTFGAGPRITISGARPNQNNFLLDGSDVQDMNHRTPSGVSGTTLGVETVREFSVLVTNFSAQYGKVAGGVINAVTKSGSNEFHGSVFAYHRNDNLDARNFFDRAKPEFKRNQFGFTAGGPIVPDRTFFFGSYEGLRDRLAGTQISTTLSAEGRTGLISGQQLTIAPEILPYLDLYPLPNGVDNGDGTGELIFPADTPTDEDYYLAKVDHNFTDSHSLFVRWVYDDSTTNTKRSFPGFENLGKTTRNFTTIEDKMVLSPTVINTFRFSFNRNQAGAEALQTIDIDPALSFVEGAAFGSLPVSGLSGYGYGRTSDRFLTLNLFEYSDDISWNRGAHSLRIGARFQRMQYNTLSAFSQNAEWVFTSIENFFNANAFRLDVCCVPGVLDSDTVRGWRMNTVGAYIQDDWQVKPNLTLNMGLRYDISTEPSEVNGQVANLVNPTTDTETTVLDTLYNNAGRFNLAPRLGFAWDIFGDGETALRGAVGVFHNVLLPVDWIFAATNLPPFFQRIRASPNIEGFPSAAGAIALLAIPPFSIDTITVDPEQPVMYKWNLNIQREIVPNLVATIGYVGSKGSHVGRAQNLNWNQFQLCPCVDDPASTDFDESTLSAGTKYWPANAPRVNPVFGDFAFKTFDTKTTYHSLQLTLDKRFSQGLGMRFSYTWSKTLDETSGANGTGEVSGSTTGSMDPHDRSRDYGLAGFHVGNTANLNFNYDLPFNASGALDKLVGGWQVNGILTMADGNPININFGFSQRSRNGNANFNAVGRPSLVPGGNNNPVVGDGREPRNYWDGSQFALQPRGTMGDLGRDTGIIPGIVTFDFSLLKNFTLHEDRSLQFRTEFFNMFNRANFARPGARPFRDSNGTPDARFGVITSTTTTGRQIQLALKFLF